MRDNTKADLLLRAQLQQDRNLLEYCARLRQLEQREVGWGEMALKLSDSMYQLLLDLFPDARGDRKAKQRFWSWFANSDYGTPYRVTDQSRRY